MFGKPIISSAVALIIGLVTAIEGFAQGGPNIVRIPVGPPGGNTAIELRYIPAGKIPKKQPSEAEEGGEAAPSSLAGLLGTSDDIEVTPFYISVNEITFAQLNAVLDPADFDKIEKRIEATAPKFEEAQYLREASKSSDMPAFAVSFDEAIKFCAKLTAAIQAAGAGGQQVSIESKRFRVPAHYEWQFACRASEDPAAVKQFPHFNKWIDMAALDKEHRAMILEEWQKLGREEAELTASQFQIFELLDARLGATDALGVPLKILSAYMKNGVGIDRDFSGLKAILHPIKGSKANSWGLFDMHGNVAEWTIKLDSRDQVLELWESVLDEQRRKAAGNRQCLILAGGGFGQIAKAKGAWKSFAIWGGYPIDNMTGELQPYKLSEGLDISENGVAVDMYPGLRIVMDRTIRSDWFLAVRKMAVVDNAGADLEPILKGMRQSANEVAQTNEAASMNALMDAYQALAVYRGGNVADVRTKFSAAAVNLAKAEKAKAGPDLGSLLGGGGNQSKEPSEDEVFFSVAAKYFQ